MTNPIQSAIAFISNAEQRHGYMAGALKAELMQLRARIADLEAQLSAVGAGGVEQLRKQAVPPAVPVDAEEMQHARREAEDIALNLFKKHYASDEDYASGRVKFGLCDSLRGVLSQIDNMTCGLIRADAAPAHPAEGVPALEVNDAMALAFHHALTDGSIGADDLEEIKIGLRAVLANVAATQPAAQGLDAKDAECLEIGRELCRACAELPWGYEIILYLEQGAGTVHWVDANGNEHDLGEDSVFSQKIGYAIAAAQDKQGEK